MTGRHSRANLLFFLCTVLFAAAPAAHAQSKYAPKVLVIATYETGKDTGDVPGELQYWVEREHLSQSIAVPGIEHPVLTNGKGLYALLSGVTSRSAVRLMALAMDPRFDLRKTYVILDGIAGGNPATDTLADAVWIKQVIDGDPAYEIDSREIPKDWPYGTIALGATKPDSVPADVSSAPAAGVSSEGSGGVGRMVYTLNPKLVDWAFRTSRGVAISDTPGMKELRAKFSAFPAAQRKPAVLTGDSLGTDHFWHGAILNQWATDWVHNYTRGQGRFAISDCEDQGIVLAMQELNTLHRVDLNRLLVLRTVSNFTVPPPGVPAEKDLFDSLVHSAGYIPALDSDYNVGDAVAEALLAGWSKYENTTPQ